MTRTCIKPPTGTFCTTVEAVREVRIVSRVRVQLTPHVEKFARSFRGSVLRWSEDLRKGSRLGLCVAWSFVPVRFGVRQI